MNYYCARLLVICLVADGKPRKRNTCDYAFVVFRARDADHAFQRALDLGREQQATYKNARGQKVRWKFARVEEIKRLGRGIDGREVGSRLDVFRSKEPIPFSQRFQPAKHQPLLS
jgi:hypothetical protein